MQGLRFIQKTSDRHAWLLASFHSPHSLTWRWTLSFYLAPNLRLWPLLSWRRDNWQLLQWWARVPFLGTLNFHQQRPMWFRNLYMRMRDEKDQMDGMLWLHDGHPHKVHRPPPPPPAPTHHGSAAVQ